MDFQNGKDLHKVYIFNLPDRFDEADLIHLAMRYGHIVKMKMPVNDRGEFLNHAYVTYGTTGEAADAVSHINGLVLRGRTVLANLAGQRGVQKPVEAVSDQGERREAEPGPSTQVSGRGTKPENHLNNCSEIEDRQDLKKLFWLVGFNFFTFIMAMLALAAEMSMLMLQFLCRYARRK